MCVCVCVCVCYLKRFLSRLKKYFYYFFMIILYFICVHLYIDVLHSNIFFGHKKTTIMLLLFNITINSP